jgi:hypothetical protein
LASFYVVPKFCDAPVMNNFDLTDETNVSTYVWVVFWLPVFG